MSTQNTVLIIRTKKETVLQTGLYLKLRKSSDQILYYKKESTIMSKLTWETMLEASGEHWGPGSGSGWLKR